MKCASRCLCARSLRWKYARILCDMCRPLIVCEVGITRAHGKGRTNIHHAQKQWHKTKDNYIFTYDNNIT